MRSPRTRDLVDLTYGRVLVYDGKPIKPWYFTQSDGRTRSYLEYCRVSVPESERENCQDIPYLQSVLDPGSIGLTRLGHGVGMSGAGATWLAEEEQKNHEEILRYFYSGIEVEGVY